MKILGKKGEAIAKEYLLKKGYQILERNWRLPFGEIDIIAKDKNQIVFVEVKSISQPEFFPYEKIDLKKKKRLIKSAQAYLLKFYPNFPWRIDLIFILQKGKNDFSLTHFKGAVKENSN